MHIVILKYYFWHNYLILRTIGQVYAKARIFFCELWVVLKELVRYWISESALNRTGLLQLVLEMMSLAFAHARSRTILW